jgi:hypothetical protein
MPAGTATVEDEVIAGDTVKEIQGQLTEMQRFVLLGKLAGISDGELAQRRGISRPTLANQKQGAFAVMRDHLSDLGDAAQAMVIDRLAAALLSGSADA